MLLFLAGYCLLLLLVGAWASRSVRSSSDFFVAGRTLPSSLLFATFLAANVGAGSTVGAAEFGYRAGLPAWWWVGSAGVGSVILALALGPRIYRVARELGLYTVGDYLEHRYGRATRRVAATVLLFGAPAVLAGQIIAAALVLQVVAGVPDAWGTVAGGALATAYFMMGGLRSAAWVNTVQIVVKVVGFGIAVPWLVTASGGWQAVAEAAPNEEALRLGGAGLSETTRLVLMLAPAFVVSPGLLQKLFGAKDERTVMVGVGLQGGVLLAYSFLPVLLGMVTRIHFPPPVEPGLAVVKLLGEVAPAWLGTLMLAAILSAEVSSADAVLFMITTSAVRDVLEPLSGTLRSDRSLLRWTRITALAAGGLGILLAQRFRSILSALGFFYSLVTITLFVPLVAGLFCKGPGQRTALLAIACALSAAGLSLIVPAARGSWFEPVPAGIAASAIVFAVARTANQPERGPV